MSVEVRGGLAGDEMRFDDSTRFGPTSWQPVRSGWWLAVGGSVGFVPAYGDDGTENWRYRIKGDWFILVDRTLTTRCAYDLNRISVYEVRVAPRSDHPEIRRFEPKEETR